MSKSFYFAKNIKKIIKDVIRFYSYTTLHNSILFLLNKENKIYRMTKKQNKYLSKYSIK